MRALGGAAVLLLGWLVTACGGADRDLRAGAVRDRTVRPPAVDSFHIALERGFFARVAIEQRGCDLSMRLEDPSGRQLLSHNRLRARLGTEAVSWQAGVSGNHRLEVRAESGSPLDCPYRLVVEDCRPGRSDDDQRITAEAMYYRAVRTQAQREKGSFKSAIEGFEDAAQLYERLGDRLWYGRVLISKAAVQLTLGNPSGARDTALAALANVRQARNSDAEVGALHTLAAAEDVLGMAEAEPRYEEALTVARAISNRAAIADILASQGAYYLAVGDNARALELNEGALSIWEALGDKQKQGKVLTAIGVLLEERGEIERALDTHHHALALRRGTGDPIGEAVALNNLAKVHYEIGEYQEAVDYYGEALRLMERAGATEYRARILANAGAARRRLGDYRGALEQYRQARELAESVSDPRTLDRLDNNVGVALHSMGRLDEARARFVSLVERPADEVVPNVRASALENLAEIDLALARGADKATREATARRALRLFAEAVDLYRGSDLVRGVTEAEVGMARAHLALGSPSTARAFLEGALERARATRDREGEERGLVLLSEVLGEEGQLEAAREVLGQGIRIAEDQASQLNSAESQASFEARRYQNRIAYVELLMREHNQSPGLGRDLEALAYSEQARARRLVGELRAGRIRVRGDVDAELLRRRDEISREIRFAAARERRMGESTSEAAADPIRSLESELERVEVEIGRQDPRHRALMGGQSVSLGEIRERVLSAGDLLVEIALGESRSYLWAVDGEGFETHELPPKEAIEAEATRFYRALVAGQSACGNGALSRASWVLANELLGPIAHRLRDKRRLLVVADGFLHHIPFAALPVPGRRGVSQTVIDQCRLLVEEMEVVSLPSASAVTRFPRPRRRGHPWRVAVFADPVFARTDPRLGAREEPSNQPPPTLNGYPLVLQRVESTLQVASTLEELVGSDHVFVATGFDATREVALSGRLSQYDLLHFGTHAVFDLEQPYRPLLILSMVDRRGQVIDGRIGLAEIFNLELDADLTVLGSCSTLLGQEIGGEGLLGLANGFLYAGSRAVVATLWDVDEESTAHLLQDFYRALIGQGMRASAALRQSQLAQLRRAERAAPYYWAPFVILGSPH